MRGEEEIPERLQSEWPQIAAQTAWKLEPLYSYCTPNDVPLSVPPPSQQSPIPALHSSAQSQNPSELSATSPPWQPSSVNDVHPPQSTDLASHNVTTHQSPDPPTQEHFFRRGVTGRAISCLQIIPRWRSSTQKLASNDKNCTTNSRHTF